MTKRLRTLPTVCYSLGLLLLSYSSVTFLLTPEQPTARATASQSDDATSPRPWTAHRAQVLTGIHTVLVFSPHGLYHWHKDCAAFRPGHGRKSFLTPVALTRQEAEKRGYTPCGICVEASLHQGSH